MAKRDKYRKLPVYQKAQEIFELAEIISEALKDDPMKEHLAGEIWGEAAIIQAKIAGAEGAGIFSIRMENAVLIKVVAQNMFNAISFAAMAEINEEDYVHLMREKLDDFKEVFKEWIRGFDKCYDIPNDWGIRFDVSTPEQEKLEELMFDEDQFFEKDDSWDDEEDGDGPEIG